MSTENKQELLKGNSVPAQFDFFNQDHFATMQRVCTMFANSELVPDRFRISEKNPKEKAIANCMIALEMATRIGASVLMVMQNLYVVYGNPGFSSKFLVATVNTCGRFNSLQYKLELKGKVMNGKEELDNWQCIAFTTAKGSDAILESTPVDIRMAIVEGWYNKNGSKWKTMPIKMLKYRSASFWTNEYAPEISMGMKTTEELEDIEDIPYEDVSQKVAQEIKANANKTTVSFDDPPKEASAEQPAPAAAPQPATTSETPQSKLNGAGF
jgi:hypothetical protein